MSDIRALLRAERAARATPEASSSSRSSRLEKRQKDSGVHPSSTELLSRAAHKSIPSSSRHAGHKRKADDSVESGQSPSLHAELLHDATVDPAQSDSHKRPRAERLESHEVIEDLDVEEVPAEATDTIPHHEDFSTASGLGAETLNEAEWEAFQADMASLEAESKPQPELAEPMFKAKTSSLGVIVAAPVTSNGASQNSEALPSDSKSSRRAAVERDLAYVRDDAARQLEMEMEEMKRLDDRVRKMKELRDSIRNRGPVALTQGDGSVPHSTQTKNDELTQPSDQSESDESDEDYDDLTWGLGRQR